jgi:D-alanyl-D-alanine carboxypeptidase (penicillin-binding protein 5/6)
MQRMIRIGFTAACAAWLLFSTAPVYAASPSAAKAKAAPKTNTTQTTARPTVARNPYVGAIVVEVTTGRVLFEDRADMRGYPASVLKLMDLLLILERIERGQLSFQDKVTVSARAAQTGGSQVWLAEKEVFTVDELLYSLMVKSANDSAVALAERVAGSTAAFVDLMNRRARELGMASTRFSSVHGLPPGPGQAHDVTTARDLARLCLEVLKRRDTLRYTSTRQRTFRPQSGSRAVVMQNHNHLLGQVAGCDGLKTGYIAAAGFSIAVTASREGQRLVAVVLGSSDRQVRDAKAAELINRAFAAAAKPVPGTARPPQPPAKPARPQATRPAKP